MQRVICKVGETRRGMPENLYSGAQDEPCRPHNIRIRPVCPWFFWKSTAPFSEKNSFHRAEGAQAELWLWSSYRFYQYRDAGLCDPDPETA